MYCKSCNIKVETHTNVCPLCKRNLIDDDTLETVNYPSIKKISNIRKLVRRIVFATCVSAILICTMINLLTFNGSYWAAIVDVGCLAVMIMFQFSMRKWVRIGKTLFTGTISIIALLIVIDMFAYKDQVSSASWSLDYTMPLILSASLLTCAVFLFFGNLFFSEFYNHAITLSLLNILMLIRINKTNCIWPILVSSSLGVIVLMMILFIFKEKLFEQIKRKFHA